MKRLPLAATLALLSISSLVAGTPVSTTAPSTAAAPHSAAAGDAGDDLAKQLANPISSLISLPLQANWDFGIGVNDATRFTLNVQPVIPLKLNDEWNLIVRTILPVIDAESPVPGIDDASGLGDVTQSFFLSPQAPVGGWILGAGPVILWPTATDDLLGTGKWGVGPTLVALRQEGAWTYGALLNHIWSVAGEGDRSDVSATFLQPFVAYITPTKTTFTLNAESTYDWEREQWTVPINAIVSQLIKVGKHPLQISLGGRYYAETPEGGPEWGVRAVVTLLFPK